MRFGLHFFYSSLVILLFLGSPDVMAQGSRSARVIAEKANLRETPTVSGLAEEEVPEGTVIKVLDEKLPWYVVRVGDRVGWLHGATLQFITTAEINESAPLILSTTAEPAPVRSSQPREETTSPTTRSGGYIRGPRGACYYISGSGRKVYVDRSLCN